MRNFEERKAEVFRRSEKRIKERKQRRNHILMACIPLVLCITLLGAFLFPGAAPEDPGNPTFDGLAGGGVTEAEYASLTCSIAKITVQGSGLSKSYTNVSEILLITDQLYSCGTRVPETNGATNNGIRPEGEDGKEEVGDVCGSIPDSANTGYTITLIMHDGETTEYYLAGDTLKNLTAKQTYRLNQTQVNELHKLLDIPNR